MTGNLDLPAGDYLVPSFEKARVKDAMRYGVIACPPNTALGAVARMMATNHVHSVIVIGPTLDAKGSIGERAWGVVSDFDLTRAAHRVGELFAADVVDMDVVTVTPDTPLRDAARLMTERGIAHLVVVHPDGGEPVGMLSTLDIAGNLAWARG